MPGIIQVRTEIPGPKSRALMARRSAAVPRGVPAVTPIAIAHAEGAVVTDVDGNRLIDFGGGIGVVNTGHRHPGVVEAVRTQLDRFAHVCFPVSTYEPYVELAERLNRVTPGTHEKRTFFVNSGAEAIENAVKVARVFTGRQAIVCFEHGFHGRTNLAMGMTSKVVPYKKGFGPFAPEIYRIPYPYCYRCDKAERRTGGVADGCCMADEAWFERHFAALVDPGTVAAIVMELELGEGGFVPAPVAYVQALAAFARAHGILVVADEIQTGFGRTGKLFACEHYGLLPDIIITAKSLAGGLPLAAVTGRAEIMEAAEPGGLGGTYGGNPLACAAALAVLDAMEREQIPARAARAGERVAGRFRSWAECYPAIGDVRGLGAMVGMELVADRGSRTPDKALTGRLLAAALRRGVILLSAGTYGNVVRVLAPLTADDALLDEGLDAVGAALAEATGSRQPS
ncbi:MAG TPA: 4-aminobutyrate--2-oxoglutarate transaminase [Gemmatimonadales bacterium]|jgi:4-aminobutyrate aminotransferase/(S)-3-amino-2-methylpropionate transaminase